MLTRRRRLYFWLTLMKSMMFPFSISAETMEITGGAKMTPTNGRIFSCWSHLQPTTSLARSLGFRENDPVLGILGAEIYPMYLLGISCGGKLEFLHCDGTSFECCLVHIGKTAGCEWCGCAFDCSWRKNERGREDIEGAT